MLRRLAVLATLCCPATAVAADDWVPARDIPAAGHNGSASLTVGPDGRETIAAIVLDSLSPLASRALLQSHLSGDPLVTELDRDPSDAQPAGLHVTAGPDGSATACFTEYEGTDAATAEQRRVVTYRAPGSAAWEAPVTLADDAEPVNTSNACEPVYGPDGTVAIIARRVVDDDEPRVTQVLLMVRRPGGIWSAPFELRSGPSSTGGTAHYAGVDSAGNVTAVWNQQTAGRGTPGDHGDDEFGVFTATRSGSTGITGLPQQLSTPNREAETLRFGMAPDGSAIAAFRCECLSLERQLTITTRTGSGSWSSPLQLVADPDADDSGAEAVGFAPDGTAYIAADFDPEGGSTGLNRAVALRRAAGSSAWVRTNLGPVNNQLPTVEVAFSGNDAVFFWQGRIGIGGTYISQAAHWRSGASAPEAERDLIAPGIRTQLSQVGSDFQGGVFGVFDRLDELAGGRFYDQVVAYDTSPPRIAPSVPSGGTVGTALAMSSVFGDLWSSVGTLSWDFGDGGTATGTAVSHVYTTPGTYTVTVKGSDTLGHERTVTAPVTITAASTTPPPVPPPGQTPADTTRPTVTLTRPSCRGLSSSSCKRRRAQRSRWRTLKGTARDNVEVARVEISVARRSGSRYFYLRGGRFRRGTRRQFETTVTRARLRGTAWSLRLPSLSRGTYLLRIRAIDTAGNRSSLLTRTLRLTR